MMKKHFFWLLTLHALFPSDKTFSQSITDTLLLDSTRSGYLHELVVSATRSTRPRWQTAEVMSVVNAAAIARRQSRTTPEALSAIPGVLVQKTNHGGGSPFLRGLTGNQTLLLIDGIRLSNATFRYGPNQYFNTIDVFSLERIEVLYGSGSVPYGSDAMGGVIQAFTRHPEYSEKARFGGNLLLRGATSGMEAGGRAEIQYSSSRAAVSGGFTRRNFGDLLGGDTTGFQRPSGYRETDFDLKGRFLLTPGLQLTLAHQQVHQQRVPVYHKIRLESFDINEMDPQRRNLSYARLEKTFTKKALKKLQCTFSFQQTEEGRNSRKIGSTVLRRETDKVRSTGLQAQAEHQSGHWSANSGAEWYADAVQSKRVDTDQLTQSATTKRGLYPDGADMQSIALYSMHTFDYRQWQFSAGARWNYFHIQVEDEAVGQATLTPSALVGNATVLRRLGTRHLVFAGVNTAFRAPNIDDLGTLGIVDFRYETPNFNLKPEHSVQVQLGHRWQNQRWQMESSVYRIELRDLIARIRQDTQTIQGYPLYRKENVEKAYIHGFETQARYLFSSKWSAEGSLAWCYGQNRTKNEPMRRIPPLTGRLALQFSPDDAWSFSAEYQAAAQQDRLAQGDKDDNRIPAGGTPAWNVFNLYAGFQWKNIRVNASFLNLFNTDYRTHGSGVNGYGRSVFATLGFSF